MLVIIYKDYSKEEYDKEYSRILFGDKKVPPKEKDRYTMYVYVSRDGKLRSIDVARNVREYGCGFFGPTDYDNFWNWFDEHERHYLDKGFEVEYQQPSLF